MPSARLGRSRRLLGQMLGVVAAAWCLLLSPLPALAQTPPPRQEIPLGDFFPTGAVDATGRPLGYTVYDDGQAMLHQQYLQVHGPTYLRRPISHRFDFNGAPAQAFEYGILVWRSDAIGADLVNIFDVLHDRGLDGWLQERYSVPPPIPWPDEPPDFASINRRHQAVLDADPDLKNFYFKGVDFPVLRHGLPMSRVEAIPNGTIVRNQRTVLLATRRWPAWVPILGRAEVELLPAGRIAAEAGLIPAEALEPGPVAERRLPLVALQSGLRLAIEGARREVLADQPDRQRLTIDLRYTNRQPTRRVYNAFDFTLLDDLGARHLPVGPVDGFLGAGTIGPNADVQGTIAYELDAGRQPRLLTYAGWDRGAPPLDFPIAAVLPEY